MKKCKIEGCEGKYCAKGYCGKHYQQFKKYGHIPERTQKDANEIIEYEDYAEIVLYDKEGNEVAKALIDLDDVKIVKQHKWYLKSTGYAHNDKVGRLHRFIMNCPDDLVVDHINHNRLDNRKENLRICTHHQNTMNKSKHSNNTSGVTGVYWDKRKSKWRARIYINGKCKYLGYYKTLEEAINARRQAEIDYYGEFSPNRED